MREFPRQDIPETQKTQAWGKLHLDFAEDILRERTSDNRTATMRYNSYNGIKTDESVAWLERAHGRRNRAKYVAYRLGRTKIATLHGEFLKRPLNATVETINVEAKTEKMNQMHFMTGAMVSKGAIEEMMSVAGVDVMEGAPIPQGEDDPVWDLMYPKDRCEDIMQIILNEQTKALNLVKKFGDNMLSAAIDARCWGKVEINEDGDVDYFPYDPRDAIYIEIEGDDFCEKSPIKRIILPEFIVFLNITSFQKALCFLFYKILCRNSVLHTNNLIWFVILQ